MDAESQAEELEVLKSIYDGDGNFSVLKDDKFQYKFGEDGQMKSFLLEIEWPADYPSTSIAQLSLEAFYNKHLPPSLKSSICCALQAEATTQLGTPMTYTLIEFAREHCEQWTADVALNQEQANMEGSGDTNGNSKSTEPGGRKEKEDKNMSKARKRRMWDRGGGTGEQVRGLDWVDIIRHLSQTGGQQQVDS